MLISYTVLLLFWLIYSLTSNAILLLAQSFFFMSWCVSCLELVGSGLSLTELPFTQSQLISAQLLPSWPINSAFFVCTIRGTFISSSFVNLPQV